MRPTIWLQIRCMIISHYWRIFGSLFSGSQLGIGRRSFYCGVLELAKIYGVRGQSLWDFGNNAFFIISLSILISTHPLIPTTYTIEDEQFISEMNIYINDLTTSGS